MDIDLVKHSVSPNLTAFISTVLKQFIFYQTSLSSLRIPIINFAMWPNTDETRDLLILRIYVLLEIALVI